jgi:SAM-dependent methyltransferase
METPPEIRDFADALARAVRSGDFYKLTLGKPRGGDPELQQLRVRPIELRGEKLLSLVTRRRNNDHTENLSPAQAISRIVSQLGTPFHSANLFTAQADLQLDFSKRGSPRLLRLPPSSAAPESAQHDRVKQRPVEKAAPWLHELGISDEVGRVRASMSDKWKQINRFIEILAHALPETWDGPFHLADFGCGRGLLTFATHGLLRERYGAQARVTGVELRPALTEEANRSVQRLGLDGLHFRAGDIRDFPDEPLHGMIALHACDTATDLALHLGILRSAELLVAAPCCHKEIRPQLRIPDALTPILRHGIHLGQQADMLTDSLRVLLLEACGYDVTLFEFISTEHTAKNRMILARKRKSADPSPEAQNDFLRLKAFFGIQHQTLETLLRRDGCLPPL